MKRFSIVWLRFLALGLCVFGAEAARAQIGLDFLNQSSYSGSSVYITFQSGAGAADCNITYMDGGVSQAVTFSGSNLLSNPILLSDVTSGSFTVNLASSVAAYVSYGTAFSNLAAAPGFFNNSVSGTVPFQNMEITYTGGAGDQSNLTNINYFTAPMNLTSYGSNGAVIQSTGFTQSTAAISSQLAALSPGGGNTATSNGQLMRYIGPSTYIGTTASAPYPSFIPYLQSVASSGVKNNIQNNSAFNSSGVAAGTYTNYNFTFLYSSTVASTGAITLSGSIQAVANTYSGSAFVSSATTYFASADVALSASNTTSLNDIIYGQTSSGTLSSAVTFSGTSGTSSGWGAFNAYVNNTGTSSASGIASSGAFSTLQAQVIGEITSAVQMGFLGNTMVVDGTALDQMQSYQWWQLNPLQAFNQIQTSGSSYYNPYAEVIYGDSYSYAFNTGTSDFNGVYGVPYSDRLGQGPLVNTTQYDGTDVSYITVGFGDPVTAAVPEPGAFGYIAIAAGFLMVLPCLRYIRKQRPVTAGTSTPDQSDLQDRSGHAAIEAAVTGI